MKKERNNLAPDGHRRRVAPRTLHRSDSPHRDLSLHPHHRSGRASPERRTVRPGRRTIGRRIRIPTVSDAIDRTDDNPFQAFKAYLPQAYPAIYSQLDTLTINEYGLVFRWPGKNPALPPILLCSHYDVFPCSITTRRLPMHPLPGWDYPTLLRAVATDGSTGAARST